MFTDLKTYGFTQTEFSSTENYIHNLQETGDKNAADLIPGRVTEIRRDIYKVICQTGEVPAELKGSFYHSLKTPDEFPAVGDFVLVKLNPRGNSLIGGLLPRRSKFSRADFGGHGEGYAKNIKEQVIVANFDYVFILSSLNYDFNVNRLARYLTASWQSGAFPVIVLSKSDLSDNPEAKAAEVRKIAMPGTRREVPVIPVSAKTGYGLGELIPFLEPAKTVVFLGSSGVGKSSLLNILAGENVMEVKEIREDDSKGRHTTTHRELFRLASGALVIDTPGMRELGLWDSKEGLSLAFAKVEELFPQCRFSNCTHQTEPGCAVLAALEDGSLSPEQWRNYQIQKKETAYVENRSEFLRNKREWHKAIAKANRNAKAHE
ncbi:putative ribosome biogenesis GTPase RsgA [Spirochaetia bacterium]|nr:putative ribosome biogenesis GTPase RsgA [Spirochaetia bacterium]